MSWVFCHICQSSYFSAQDWGEMKEKKKRGLVLRSAMMRLQEAAQRPQEKLVGKWVNGLRRYISHADLMGRDKTSPEWPTTWGDTTPVKEPKKKRNSIGNGIAKHQTRGLHRHLTSSLWGSKLTEGPRGEQVELVVLARPGRNAAQANTVNLNQARWKCLTYPSPKSAVWKLPLCVKLLSVYTVFISELEHCCFFLIFFCEAKIGFPEAGYR